MATIDEDGLSSGSMPNLHGAILASRGDARAIRRPDHGSHLFGMTTIGTDGVSSSSIPNLYCTIPGAGGETHAIGRPRHSIDTIGMVAIGKERDSSTGVPYLHSLIPGARGEMRSIGRPGHSCHPFSMALIERKKGSWRWHVRQTPFSMTERPMKLSPATKELQGLPKVQSPDTQAGGKDVELTSTTCPVCTCFSAPHASRPGGMGLHLLVSLRIEKTLNC